MTQQPPRYTDEVMAALRQQAAMRGDDPPAPPALPAGHVQYHVAVGDTVLAGAAPSHIVAASLRALAAQLDNNDPTASKEQ